MFRRILLQTPLRTRATSSPSSTTALPSIRIPLNRPCTSSPRTTIYLPRRFLSTETRSETGAPAADGTGDPTTENGGQKPAKNGEQKQAAGNGNGNGNGNGGLAGEVAKIKAELEAKEKEAADFKDKFLRSVAEFRNLQDRSARDMKAAKDFAIQRFAKDLVETVDNVDRALSSVPEQVKNDPLKNKELYDLFQGVKMTESILLSTLEKHGLQKIDPVGQKFDPNLHEAVFQAPMEGKEPGVVFYVQRTGFTLNGRTLRAAQVGIVQAAPPSTNTNASANASANASGPTSQSNGQ